MWRPAFFGEPRFDSIRKNRPWLALAILICLGGILNSATAASPTEYEIKAAFLYKFCLYIEWPEQAFAGDSDPLVIGIDGPSRLLHLVETVTHERTIRGRPIEVRPVENERDADQVHLLFVARSRQAEAAGLMAAAAERPVLLVTESPDGFAAGSVINFVLREGRVRFDVELDAAKQQGLWFSAQLLRVARTVHEVQPHD